jgi:hypothetical protein
MLREEIIYFIILVKYCVTRVGINFLRSCFPVKVNYYKSFIRNLNEYFLRDVKKIYKIIIHFLHAMEIYEFYATNI